MMDFYNALRKARGTERKIRFRGGLWYCVRFTATTIEFIRSTKKGIDYDSWMLEAAAQEEKAWEVEPLPEELYTFAEAFAAALKRKGIDVYPGENWSKYYVHEGEPNNHDLPSYAVLMDNEGVEWWPTEEQTKSKWRVEPEEKEEKEEPEEKKVLIKLSGPEIQSGSSRVNWAEGLIVQLPKTHEGRNSWLLNYGKGEEAQALRRAHNDSQQWDDETDCLAPSGGLIKCSQFSVEKR